MIEGLSLIVMLAKADAGKVFCEQATAHAVNTGGKPWTYLLIPESSVASNMTLAGLERNHAQ